eukprot:517184_1
MGCCSTTPAHEFDFSIFQTSSTECKRPTNRIEIIPHCSHLKRVAMALKYFEVLFVDETSNHNQDKFMHFCMDIYSNFLDDFIHIIQTHQECDLLKIAQELENRYEINACHVKTCKKFRRHYRDRGSSSDDNETFIFYVDCYDSIHHQIFHLFQIGLRTENMEAKDNNDIALDSFYIDEVFVKKRNLCQKLQVGLKIDRYEDENNKFVLHVEQKETSGTFLDSLYRQIEKSKYAIKLQKLKEFIYDNEYDSDAVKNDVYDVIETENNRPISTSNIYEYNKNAFCIWVTKKFIKNTKLSSNSFSTGFYFYYWDGFKNIQERNIGDKLNGYSPAELFVLPYFSSLKHEILESGFITINQWNMKIIFKGEEYSKTNRAKKIKCHGYTDHGFFFGTVPSLSHFLCIILYCDFGKLQTHFSATFRKQNPFEPIKTVKQRNSKYYYFSK